MNSIPKVIDLVVNNDLCIGCGLCTYKCPSKALDMQWNEYGFLVPVLSGNCGADGACLTVCPFNPYPEKDVKTENELADIFLTDTRSAPKEETEASRNPSRRSIDADLIMCYSSEVWPILP